MTPITKPTKPLTQQEIDDAHAWVERALLVEPTLRERTAKALLQSKPAVRR